LDPRYQDPRSREINPPHFDTGMPLAPATGRAPALVRDSAPADVIYRTAEPHRIEGIDHLGRRYILEPREETNTPFRPHYPPLAMTSEGTAYPIGRSYATVYEEYDDARGPRAVRRPAEVDAASTPGSHMGSGNTGGAATTPSGQNMPTLQTIHRELVEINRRLDKLERRQN
jgi:hypothetical protein